MNRRSLYIAAVVVTMIIMLSLPALADYHYASHAGTNTPPYTSWATAADSIQLAVDACGPHDTIYIGQGVWEQRILTYEDDSISIIGMGIDSTIILVEPLEMNDAIRLDYDCSVQDLTVRRPLGGQGIHGMPYAGIKVSNCKIRATIAVNCYAYPTYISNCIMDSCSEGINVYMGPYVEITNNIISNVRGSIAGIELYTHAALVENNIIDCSIASSIVGLQGDNVYTGRIIRNNLIIKGRICYGIRAQEITNNIASAGIYGILSPSVPRIVNNSIFGNWYGSWDVDSTFFGYNNFYNNHIDIMEMGPHSESTGNIFANPMYVSDRDFHLQAYSPLIDAGDPNILDVDGTRSDIGCYGGPYGCSYTYLDLAPAIPESINVDADSADIVIRWRYNTEADFNHYKIYRDTVTGFTPSWENCIAEMETSLFVDEDINPSRAYYYRLSSVDNQHNESDYSDEVAVIPNDISNNQSNVMPTYTTIESAYPNPGNAHFTIVYSASNLGPQPPQITLKLYDIQGRVVRTLVDERKQPGTYRAVWDGTNDTGQPVSSGVYVAKVSQWGMDGGDFPIKITVVK